MIWAQLAWWRPPCLLRSVLVNLRHDHEAALRGVLWNSRGPWLTLRDCTLLRPNVEPVTMDGEVVIHRDNVAFFQVLYR